MPPTKDLNEWEDFGAQILGPRTRLNWKVAYWLLAGEERYPEEFLHVAEMLGVETKTLYNYKSIAKSFLHVPPSEVLSIGHHEPLANRNFTDEERGVFLAEIEANGWTREETRDEAKKRLAAKQIPPKQEQQPAWADGKFGAAADQDFPPAGTVETHPPAPEGETALPQDEPPLDIDQNPPPFDFPADADEDATPDTPPPSPGPTEANPPPCPSFEEVKSACWRQVGEHDSFEDEWDTALRVALRDAGEEIYEHYAPAAPTPEAWIECVALMAVDLRDFLMPAPEIAEAEARAVRAVWLLTDGGIFQRDAAALLGLSLGKVQRILRKDRPA